MKQWQQTHFILTAASVPVAILVCWLVYKRTSKKRETKPADGGAVNKVDEATVPQQSSEDTRYIGDDSKFSTDATAYVSSSLLDAVDSDSSDNNAEISSQIASQTVKSPAPESNECMQSTVASEVEDGNKSFEKVEAVVAEAVHSELENPVEVSVVKNIETESEILPTDASSNIASPSSDDHAVADSEETKEAGSEHTDTSSYDEKSLSSLESDDILQTSEDEIKSMPDKSIDQNTVDETKIPSDQEKQGANNVAIPSNLVNGSHEDEEDSSVTDLSSLSELQETEPGKESLALNSDSNMNNNNSTESKFTNGQTCSPLQKNARNNTDNNYCNSCSRTSDDDKTKEAAVSTNGQNGWNDSHSNKTDSDEPGHDGGGDKNWRKRRPNSLPKLDCHRNGESAIQVHVEFPSAKVGLLIGKQGRNIKQLKQDSGADVYVHAAKFRDDIQVLQICGTQSEIESCVSRIKRRFNDVTLTPFDPANLVTSPPSSSGISPNPNSPPPVLYSMPNIAQLRLMEGRTIDVLVSAIASVDCLFLQQYMHPSYPLLDNLERAMSLCYAEPTTPCLPKPVQTGLICAAPQDGMWYRSQVIQIYEDSDEILIKFMDYGGYATVSYDSIKQIRADFVSIPFQAIECYLDNIAPPEDKQVCEETVSKIADILKEGRYQARVTGYRSDGNPKIHLYKCHNNEVLLVNEMIVTKGLATWLEPAPFK